MNTTKKGDSFEEMSLTLIENVLKNEELGIIKEHARVYRKKGYYSERRKGDIIFDLAIELWPPNASRYSMLYLVECKNYSHKVPVDDIEEFVAKISQIGGVNNKGIFITNSFLQKSALNYAESQGLMLIKANTERKYDIILHKTSKGDPFQTQFTFPSSKSLERRFSEKVENLIKLCFAPKSIIENFNIPELSKEDIESIAEFEINKINPLVLKSGHLFSPKNLIDYLKREYGIQVKALPSDSKLLGSCDVKNNTIFVHPKMEETKQYYFVLAHEFGHYILHKNLEISQEVYESYDDAEYSFRTNKYELTNPKHWIEWQANYFASNLILHKYPVMKLVLSYQRRHNLSEGIFYLNDQNYNQEAYQGLITQLAYLLEVSKTSIIYRLSDLGIVINKTRIKSIGQIISEYEEDLFI